MIITLQAKIYLKSCPERHWCLFLGKW